MIPYWRHWAPDSARVAIRKGGELPRLFSCPLLDGGRADLRLAPAARTAPQDLERLPFSVTAADGATRIVRLNQVATVREGTGPNQINRRDLTREVSINANVARRSAGEVSAFRPARPPPARRGQRRHRPSRQASCCPIRR